jgi:transmembrane sensor
MGARSDIKLSDGSSVWLNAGSKLTYTKSFGSDNRTVHLEGEGFFSVAHDPDNPFTVITSHLEIVALGTSFNVKSYPEEEAIQTTLVSGSLLINRTRYKSIERGLLLEPNQQVIYYRESRDFIMAEDLSSDLPVVEDDLKVSESTDISDTPKIILRSGVNPEVFTSWKDNRLVLKMSSLEVLQ